MSTLMRHGLPAAVSAVLASGAGLLGNAFSNGWAWPVGVFFGVAVLVEAGWLATRAVHEHGQPDGHTGANVRDGAAHLNRIGRVTSRRGQAIGINYGDVRQDKRK